MNLSKSWENLFKQEQNRWKEPNKYVSLLVKHLKNKTKPRVLDVGCGAGRHIVFLSKKGFDVYGFDLASNTKALTEQKIKTASLKTFDMNKHPWPYKNCFFDGVLSINTIHHTNYNGFVKIIDEIFRVLAPNGLFLATIASKENHKFKEGKRLDNWTYVTSKGAEKGIPHCFFNEADIKKIFSKKFKIIKLQKIEGEIPEADKALKKKGSLDHLLLFAQKNNIMTTVSI